MSSKNANSQGRRTPLTLSQGKMSLMQSQPVNKRQAAIAENETIPQRERETRKQQQTKHQQHKQQYIEQLKKEEEKKEAASIAAAVNKANAANNEAQQVAALKNGYNKNESKNGNATTVPAKSNGSAANTHATEVNQEKETRNNNNKQTKEQQHNKNDTDAELKNVGANSVQHKQPQLQTAEPKPATSPVAKKPVEEKVEPKPQATVEVVEKVEKLQPAQQETTKQAENVAAESSSTTKEQQQVAKTKQEQQEAEQQQQIVEEPKIGTPTKADNAATITAKASSSPMAAPKVTPVKKYSVTTSIDYVELDDSSPRKDTDHIKMATVSVVVENPNATSTPGNCRKSGWQQRFNTPEHAKSVPMRNISISGRRSIRPFNEWTTEEFEQNSQLRGSYRRMKTDLDATADTNTSLNVTVGSEPGNTSSWFSFSSRKRERTPSNVANVKEDLLSPPKRARFESLFSIMASPISALRSRFAKTTIHASNLSTAEEQEEKSMSMQEDVSIQEVEDLLPLDAVVFTENKELSNKEQIAAADIISDLSTEKAKEYDNDDSVGSDDDGDIELVEATDSANTVANKKRCDIM